MILKKQKIIFSLVLVLAVVLFFYFYPPLRSPGKIEGPILNVTRAKIDGVIVSLELAVTPEAQARGLSGKESLAEDQGMLFVFSSPGRYPFWMKDMNFPIDIIWIGQDFKVVYIQKNASPASYPESFVPEENAEYVLEVSSGFSDKNNVKEGDRVLFF